MPTSLLVRHNGNILAPKLRLGLIDAFGIASSSVLLFAQNLAILTGRENINTT